MNSLIRGSESYLTIFFHHWAWFSPQNRHMIAVCWLTDWLIDWLTKLTSPKPFHVRLYSPPRFWPFQMTDKMALWVTKHSSQSVQFCLPAWAANEMIPTMLWSKHLLFINLLSNTTQWLQVRRMQLCLQPVLEHLSPTSWEDVTVIFPIQYHDFSLP